MSRHLSLSSVVTGKRSGATADLAADTTVYRSLRRSDCVFCIVSLYYYTIESETYKPRHLTNLRTSPTAHVDVAGRRPHVHDTP